MSNQLSQDIINRVKDRADIVQIIGESLKLQKRGRNYVGICPFHADKAPSLSVSPQRNMYTCFACGATGDVISFVQNNEKLTFSESIRHLARKYSIEIPEVSQSPEEKEREKQRESVLIVTDQARQQFIANLKAFQPAYTYINAERLISDETLALYQVGFASADNQLSREMPSRGYSFELMMAAGLTATSDEKKFKYDVFRQRIVFPYIDLHGRTIGFTGRIIDKDAKAAKYLNTSDTVIFNKGNVLYGLYQAREAIQQSGKAYLLEGQLDVLSLSQRGVRNSICGSGTALTDNQARLLKRFTNTVVICYDPDAAGLKASIANARTLLSHGFDVRAILLPNNQDPDDFAKASSGVDLPIVLQNLETNFIEYFYAARNVASASDFENSQLLDQICECIAVVPDKYLREKYTLRLSKTFGTDIAYIRERVKPSKEFKVEKWKAGFYGIDEAKLLIEDNEDATCSMVFQQEDFMLSFSETPTVLAIGSPSLADIQNLRSFTGKITINISRDIRPSSDSKETKQLQLLKNMHKNGFDIIVESDNNEYGFCDYYVDSYSRMLTGEGDDERITDSTKIAEIIGRCAEVISHLDATVRVVMVDVYAKKLQLKPSAFEKVLKPFLAKKKDKAMIDSQRLGELGESFSIDSEVIPEYVEKDKALWNLYNKWGFYPLADKDGRYFTYMFKNQTGSSHFPVSDFYMKPLLHIYDESNDDANNKRVIQLCHMDKRLDKYVEWRSSVFANLPKVHEKLVNSGPFNFFGNMDQYRRIWMNMSYGFTKCYPTGVLGWHRDGFFVFGNAIYHKIDNEYRIDYVDELGVVTHDDTNYYMPAFSKIHLDRNNNGDRNRYKLARDLMYKEIPDAKRTTFERWAWLMDNVYCTNHNGKWALLYAITCTFRDFIFENRGVFTAPFFMGPTSSGKSQVAESIRNLFMDSKMAAFNLNTGTLPAFFMFIESIRNVPIVMEEYNDNSINPMIFQALKAATLDGQGRIKVADTSSKTMDSSEINASLILLGQEAPQRDDGSLANRCILLDVPTRDFTDDDRVIFEELKEYEKNGLSNILLQVLQMREKFEKNYLGILADETNQLKQAVKVNITNTEGLMRIVNAVALMTSTCRLIEDYVPELKLPFTAEEFRPIAIEKILSQIDRIATTNKLATYFQTISTLITHDKIRIGRELKVAEVLKITKKKSSKDREVVEFNEAKKILFLCFEDIYLLYQHAVSRTEPLSRQSLISYFASNPAYLGLSNSTRFQWMVSEYTGADVDVSVSENIEVVNAQTNARLRMIEKSKVTSAYMFDYEHLKTLIDIDFERNNEAFEASTDEEPLEPGEVPPPTPTNAELPF